MAPPGLGVPRNPPQLHDSAILRTAAAQAQHSAAWTLERCPLCNYYRLSLVAATELLPGTPITLQHKLPLLNDQGLQIDWVLQTDGCGPSRSSGGWGGAGARLLDHRQGRSTVRWETSRGVRDYPTAERAEATALALGLRLLINDELPGRRLLVVGDRHGALRTAAGATRLRDPAAQGLLQDLLAQLVAHGWAVEWRVVSRRLNQAADAVADRGRHSRSEETRTYRAP